MCYNRLKTNIFVPIFTVTPIYANKEVPMSRILIVEDDLELCEILQFYLLQNPDYQVTIAHSGENALALAKVRPFDLVLLDIMLPGMDGLEFCECLRRISYCPVIFISCLNDDETVIRALNMGGDDYLIKPFKAPVLMARIEANLRRSQMVHPSARTLQVRNLVLNTETHSVYKSGEEILLSPTEYEILFYLFSNRGRFISFDEIYDAIWQRPSFGDMRTLFVHISHLRQKIEDNPQVPYYIRTQLRDGYIFAAE